jgi:hypothetical protein
MSDPAALKTSASNTDVTVRPASRAETAPRLRAL